MPNTFTIVPSYTSIVETEFAVTSVRFGKGYELRAKSHVINNSAEKYALTFDHLTDLELGSLQDFLRVTFGVDYFLWTPPFPGYDTQKKFVCRDGFKVESLQFNDNRLTCVFEQVFDP